MTNSLLRPEHVLLEFLKSLPPVTLKYEPEGSLPDGDDPVFTETIIASDALASKGIISKPISGRGHPKAIYWRKLKREARLRRTPARKVKNQGYQKALRMRRRGGNVLVFREHKYWPLYVTFLGPVMDRRLYIVQNMKTGETKKFKAPKYLFDALREKYPGDGYVGRSFAIMPDRISELEQV